MYFENNVWSDKNILHLGFFFGVVSFLGPENQRLLENFVFLSLYMTAVNLADILNKRVWKLYSAIIVFSNV